jgi:hypothetical protein
MTENFVAEVTVNRSSEVIPGTPEITIHGASGQRSFKITTLRRFLTGLDGQSVTAND